MMIIQFNYNYKFIHKKAKQFKLIFIFRISFIIHYRNQYIIVFLNLK